ncbi:His-Xaa-Ser system protein HxsD [Vibrio crassostreae]|uniref:hypothetical protein n=1 Tax=Vibrio crassostreae TaxID=246167 RepID=UPI000F469007|nr:hypothetical protein [Vibrio crassostreae]ROR22260.1 His-Xaa-Ser system protein HxsD [Vibrio crassostreae]
MSSSIPTKNIDSILTVRVQKSLYKVETVEAAIIPLMDVTTAFLSKCNEHIEINFTLDDTQSISIQDVEKAFLNNLIHESLREKIARETETERNLILAHAFSNSKLMVNQ